MQNPTDINLIIQDLEKLKKDLFNIKFESDVVLKSLEFLGGIYEDFNDLYIDMEKAIESISCIHSAVTDKLKRIKNNMLS